MKKFCSVIALVLVLSLIPGLCYADFMYPAYTGANQNQPEITERINIVFDNSGHDEVKQMLQDVVRASVVAENTAIWIYPIAGSAEPIRVTPGKDFMDNHFTAYAKSSNEFKAENVMDAAMADLLADASVTNKRFILYANYETSQLRKEYDIYSGVEPFLNNSPGVIFSAFRSNGKMMDKSDIGNYNASNIDYLSDSNFLQFMLVKNGYSPCERVYNQETGILKIEKGKADNNVFVLASNEDRFVNSDDQSADIYLGGAMMGTKGYEAYQKKSKVTGVALSYHHTILDSLNQVAALFTADGVAVNPLNDDVYIPLINASGVSVYQRSAKGSGICSAETSYNAAQDKKIANYYAPKETTSGDRMDAKTALELASQKSRFNSEPETVPQKILAVVKNVIGTIFRLLFIVLRLLIFAFIILMIVHRKFRSYIQLKILNTKFGPLYEKTMIKIKKIITDIAGAGAKIRGNADLKGDYIFISKASADMGLPNNRITLLVRELESRGIACWLSENGIKAGEDYNVVLPQAIKSCTLFLLFVSPMSVKSSEVVSEIGTAKEHKKSIIPVQIEPFDLFKEFPNWAYMLKQYQKTELFSSKDEDIKALADQVESTFNNLKK